MKRDDDAGVTRPSHRVVYRHPAVPPCKLTALIVVSYCCDYVHPVAARRRILLEKKDETRGWQRRDTPIIDYIDDREVDSTKGGQVFDD